MMHNPAAQGQEKRLLSWRLPVAVALTAMLAGTTACWSSPPPQERYVSGQNNVQAGSKINLSAVQQAFWDTKGNDFNGWMGNFEQRVNQIYEGPGVVSIDANRDGQYFKVTGFINRDADPSYNPNADEKLFEIAQTGNYANNQMPYTMSGWDNRPYYSGYHGITHSPLLDALLVGYAVHAMTRPPHYYTPATRTVVIRQEVSSYRNTPQYNQQRQSNSSFSRSYAGNSGQSTSSRSFGTTGSTTGTRNRSWSGANNSTSGNTSSSGWSGRRGGSESSTTSSTTGSTSGSSGWSGRRSGSSSGSSSSSSSSGWSGRRSSSSGRRGR